MNTLAAKAVLRVVLPYVVFAGLWILLSDRLLASMMPDAAARTQWSIYKGWAFVLVTALLLYFLLRFELKLRERDQAALRESQELLRHRQALLEAVTEGTPDAVYVKDNAGRYLMFNEGASRFVGKPKGEVLGRDDTALFSPEDARLIMEGDRRVRESAITQTYEEQITIQGKPRTFLATKGPVLDSQGRVIGLFGIAHDISERQQAVTRVRQAHDFYLQVLQEAPALIWRANTDAKCDWFNQSWLEFTGRPLAQELGDGWAEGVHPDDFQRCLRTYLDAFAARQSFKMEYRLRHHSGEFRWLLDVGRPLHNLSGEFAGYIGYCFDISNLKEAETRLRRSEERFRSTLDQMKEGCQIIGFDWRYLYVNTAAEQHNRRPGRELLGRTVTEAWPGIENNPVFAAEQKCMAERVSVHMENEFVFPDGAKGWFDLGIQPVPEGIFILSIDISERKRMEEEQMAMEGQMRQQQKLESIGTLAAGVAHEINNPINGVMNYAQLILDCPGTHPETLGYAREIILETERVATIVRNLLKFARIEKQTHSPALLQDVVSQTLSLIRTVIRSDQITLVVEVSADLPPIKCRSQQIQQVLMNLLTNARDALNQRYPAYHEDKIIRLNCRLLERDGRRWMHILVEDHGVGIPQEMQERIFDPFFTTKPRNEGTGLGLTISHGIVRDHHGLLWLETEPGQGTKFHVELPVDNGWNL
jgi:PAS domain S-box-containing protein